MARLPFTFGGLWEQSRSLRSVLSVYFIPISIIPVILVSVFATRELQKTNREFLVTRAQSERDALIAEIESMQTQWLDRTRAHATRARLVRAVSSGSRTRILQAISSFQGQFDVRVYDRYGNNLVDKSISDSVKLIPYIAKKGLRQLRRSGATVGRYFIPKKSGLVTITRTFIRKQNRRIIGILEELHFVGDKQLMALQQRRQVDIVLLKPDFAIAAKSFAISDQVLKPVYQSAFEPAFGEQREPTFVSLGESRYAGFLFPMDRQENVRQIRKKRSVSASGYLALFVSMSKLDASTGRLKLYLVYLTAILVLFSSLFILVVARRLVRPLERLVAGMKRIKAGRLEQIPDIESPYEVDYMVRSFNDMARNIHSTKRALELKLKELGRANEEIKNTQSTLVQSAKMVSLGQIVAGVAHELNNPIAFIYSNMHHLNEYVDKIKTMQAEYEKLGAKLSASDRKKLEKVKKDLDIDYILKDIEQLSQSCLDGAQRTKEIVLGLRTFSRMDEAVFKPSDINEGLRSTVRLLVSQLKDRIQLHEEYEDLPPVECNLSQLNQVFMNLISNAAQAIPNRGDIFLRTRRVGERVEIEVEDTGKGISEAMREKIFDPFFTTKTVGEGTGLGLSIAYGLVQKHGGEIRVESEQDQGTCFTISLPIKQSDKPGKKEDQVG